MGGNAGECRAVVTVKGGASLVQCRSIFSADSKYVLCPSGHHVKVFAVASGDCVRELKGHTDVVTGIRLNPKNHFQVLTCSLDGSVKLWDLLDGAMLKSYEFRAQLHGLYAIPNAGRINTDDPSVLAITQQSRKAFSVVHGTLVEGESDVKKVETIFPSVGNQENLLAVGCQGEIVAYVFGQVLGIYSFSKRQHNEQKLSDEEEFTCVACHPSEQCIVTGTSSGRIYYWYNLLGGNKVIRTSYHWHSLPVLDLCFTSEGSCLLSGGHECVLVKWQYGTQQKDFLPRLGGPIIHVSCSGDSTAYAVSHADNVIQIVSNGFLVHQVFQGLTRDHLAQNADRPLPAGLLLDPRTGSLVTNGKPGHLQFFSLAEDKLLYNLDIVGQNYVSSYSLSEPLKVTQVECADFDRTGAWLATIEGRSDGLTADEIRLKFWEYKKESQTYVLNTDVNLPHSKKVHCVRFSKASATDSSLAAVTASADGRFKLWSLVDNSDIYRKGKCWNCESVGYYKGFSCGDASFSDDGSLLAVAFEHAATLWDPEVNSMRMALPVASVAKGVHIRQLLFGSGTSSHLLVITTDVSVTVWNLLSCSVLWTTAAVKPQLIVRDPCSSHMALFTATRSLIVFVPSDPRPVHVQHEVSPTKVVSAFFVPLPFVPRVDNQSYGLPWQRQSRLYYVDKLQMLLTLDHEDNAADAPDKRSAAVVQKAEEGRLQENIPLTPFSLLIGAERKRKPDVSRSHRWRSHQDKTKHLVQQMINTPAHVQPPVTVLCKRFVSACVLDGERGISPRSNLEDGCDDDDDDDDDDDAAADPIVNEGTADVDMSSGDSDNDASRHVKNKSNRRHPVSLTTAATASARDSPSGNFVNSKPLLEPSALDDFDWLAKEVTCKPSRTSS